VKKPCIWTTVNEKTIDNCIELAHDFAADSICQFHGFFKNWGHFDVNEQVYPSGVDGVKAVSAKCKKAGIHNITYTLSSFVRPHPAIEPYIAPVPDKRLAYFTLKTSLSLAEPVSKEAKSMKIRLSKGLTDDLNDCLKGMRKVFRIDNEMLEFKSWKKLDENTIECTGLSRGGWLTTVSAHKAGASATFMLVSGYNNFYPGNLEMSNEVADNIARITAEGEIGQVTLDGYESVLACGLGSYGKNVYLQRIYDATRKNEVLFTASNYGNYSWHAMSFMSWGEFDREKGFRGTMLEIRLANQVRLLNSIMPNRMGQYYPDKNTTVEDIEWLCNQIAGWDSGVDLCIDYDNVHQNPDYEKVAATFRLWSEAVDKQIFSEKTKIKLRQPGSIYRLTKDSSGRFRLKFLKRWIDPRVKMMPSSSFPIKPVGSAEVHKCGIDWYWTHNPAIYSRACLSDDLVCPADGKKREWNITVPAVVSKRVKAAIGLRCVIRPAEGSAAGVSNIQLRCSGSLLDIRHVKIEPGEYLSIPHDNQYAYIYDAKTHAAKRAVYIHQSNPYWFLPQMNKGKQHKISLSCDSTEPGKSAGILVNIQYHDKYFKAAE
jgi:hypothetical protein